MVALSTISDGDQAVAADVNQLIEAMNGVGNTPVLHTGVNDDNVYALSVKNAGAGGKSFRAIDSSGSDRIRVTSSGVEIDSTGSGTLALAVTRSASETLTNKTLTTPTIADFSNATHSHQDAAGGGVVGAWVKIADTLLTSSAASIAFAGVPQTYAHLRLHVIGRGEESTQAVALNLRFNSDNSTAYRFVSVDDGVAAASTAGTAATVGAIPGSSAAAGNFGAAVIDLPHYTSTAFKQAVGLSGWTSSATDIHARHSYVSWGSTAASTHITLLPGAGQFSVGTRATLYGITS